MSDLEHSNSIENDIKNLNVAVQTGNLQDICRLIYFEENVHMSNEIGHWLLDVALRNRKLECALILFDFCENVSEHLYMNYQSVFSNNIPFHRRLPGMTFIDRDNELGAMHVNYFKRFTRIMYDKLRSSKCLKPILVQFLIYCNYSEEKFVDCLCMLLSLPDTNFLLHNYNPKYTNVSYLLLLSLLVKANMRYSNRIKVVAMWNSLGTYMSLFNVDQTIIFLGFHREVESLIHTTAMFGSSPLSPHSTFVLGLDENRKCVDLFIDFLNAVANGKILSRMSYIHHIANAQLESVMLRNFSYYTVPFWARNIYLELYKDTVFDRPKIIEKLKTLPQVPKLVELSRNASRKHIRNVNNVAYCYQFLNAVKKLDVPPIVKDILTFKQAIYL